MVRDIDNGKKEKAIPHFRSRTYISLENDDNEHNLNEAYQKMNGSLEEFIHKGSNWVLNKIISMEINTVKYSLVTGSSYRCRHFLKKCRFYYENEVSLFPFFHCQYRVPFPL
jgi:hypothetical protein